MFGRATITLGIGSHSSILVFSIIVRSCVGFTLVLSSVNFGLVNIAVDISLYIVLFHIYPTSSL